MRRKSAFLFVVIMALALVHGASANDFCSARVAVWYSPRGGCTDAVVQELRGAKHEVLVQAYSFTSAPIAAALRDAHRRGVKVTAVLDKSNSTAHYSAASFLVNAGIPTYIDSRHAIAHNKIMVIDGREVLTGSFNFTTAAEESNAENLLVIRDAPELVREYTANFQAHLTHSAPYQRALDSSDRRDSPAPSMRAPTTGRHSSMAPVAVPMATTAATDTVYITKSGRCYHRAGCRGLSRSQIPIGRRDAEARGYAACRLCNP